MSDKRTYRSFEDEVAELRRLIDAPEEEFDGERDEIITELASADRQAVEIALDVAWKFLKKYSVSPLQIIGLGHAIYALQRYPEESDGVNCAFGVSYTVGDRDYEEYRYIDFRVYEDSFSIVRGGSTYTSDYGSDSYTEPGWRFVAGEYYDGDQGERAIGTGELVSIKEMVFELLDLGGKITVDFESDVVFEE